jgi:hypothetical protein
MLTCSFALSLEPTAGVDETKVLRQYVRCGTALRSSRQSVKADGVPRALMEKRLLWSLAARQFPW